MYHNRHSFQILTLADVPGEWMDLFKEHARIDREAQVRITQHQLDAAVHQVETDIRGFLRQASVLEAYDMFPLHTGGPLFELHRWPVESVSSIKYIGSDGNEATWDAANYQVTLLSKPVRIFLADGGTLPDALARPESVKIEYVCNYTPTPPDALQAIMEAATTFYEERTPDDTAIHLRKNLAYEKSIRNLMWSW